jgi:hypothetical protein
MNRRELLHNTGLIAAAGGVWLAVRDLQIASAATTADPTLKVDPLLDIVCDLVIPDTTTPGARKAGVPAFVAMATQHHLAGASPADLAVLETALNQAAGRSFLDLTPAAQNEVLSVIDSAADAVPAWQRIKQLIVMGYYTSEIGASQELQYQLVPGRFDPDLPVKPGDRAWSSDWIGQGF